MDNLKYDRISVDLLNVILKSMLSNIPLLRTFPHNVYFWKLFNKQKKDSQ